MKVPGDSRNFPAPADVAEHGQSWSERMGDYDAAVIERLRADRFCGPAFDAFQAELARYGVAVIEAWLRTGKIFDHARTIGRSVGQPSDVTHSDLEELAIETVVNGLRLFTRELVAEKWDSEKSSLKTYFVGACLMSFPNVYRNFQRELTRRPQCIPTADLSEVFDVEDARPQPDEVVVLSAEVERILRRVRSPVARKVLILRYIYECSVDEIAESLGITAKAVRMHVSRALRQIRELETRSGAVSQALSYANEGE